MDDTATAEERSVTGQSAGVSVSGEARTLAAIREAPTLAQIKGWPASVPISKACTAFGISRSHGYELAARGEFPARVIKAGGRWVVVTADVVRALSPGA